MNDNPTPWYVLRSPEVGRPFHDFVAACRKTGVLEKKTLVLLRIVMASVTGCPRNLEERIREGLDSGLSKEEITEALLLAAVEKAGASVAWNMESCSKHLR